MFEEYCSSLEAGLTDKVQLILPWIPTDAPGEVIDIGSGTAGVAAAIAARRPGCSVIAVDKSPRMLGAARWRRGSCSHRLAFRHGDARVAHSDRASAVVLSSVLHEVYSSNGNSIDAVAQAILAASRSLIPNGRIIIRDFVRPAGCGRQVELRQLRTDIIAPHDFSTFAAAIGRPDWISNIRYEARHISYTTNLGAACEFAFRKDFHLNWKSELRETYGFWNLQEAGDLIQQAGLRLVFCGRLRGSWSTHARFSSAVRIFDRSRWRPYPAQQVLLVAEHQSSIRRAPAASGLKPSGQRVREL